MKTIPQSKVGRPWMLPLALAPVFLVALASRQSIAVAHRISRTEFLSRKPSIYGEPTPAPITIHKRQFILPDFERPPMPDPTTLQEYGPPRVALPQRRPWCDVLQDKEPLRAIHRRTYNPVPRRSGRDQVLLPHVSPF